MWLQARKWIGRQADLFRCLLSCLLMSRLVSKSKTKTKPMKYVWVPLSTLQDTEEEREGGVDGASMSDSVTG